MLMHSHKRNAASESSLFFSMAPPSPREFKPLQANYNPVDSKAETISDGVDFSNHAPYALSPYHHINIYA